MCTAFCFIAKLHVHRFECKASIFFTDSQVKMIDCVHHTDLGRHLQLVRARFFNFLLGKLSREFKLVRLSIFHSNGHISVAHNATVTCLGTLVVLHILCTLMWPWPDPRSRSQSVWISLILFKILALYKSFTYLLTIGHNCTFPGLSPPPILCAAQNWWLILIVWDLKYSLSEPDFRISFYKSYQESSNFANIDISRYSNGRISLLHDATVTSFWTLVVLFVLCMLMSPWPDPRSRSRSHSIWTSNNCP